MSNEKENSGEAATGWQAATSLTGTVRPAARVGAWAALVRGELQEQKEREREELGRLALAKMDELLSRTARKGQIRTGQDKADFSKRAVKDNNDVKRTSGDATTGWQAATGHSLKNAEGHLVRHLTPALSPVEAEREKTSSHGGNCAEKAGSNMKSHEATEKDDEVGGVKGEGRPAFAQGASARQARVEMNSGKVELGILDFGLERSVGNLRGMKILTLGHSPDPDDAFMFYGLAKELIPSQGFRFEHILQDIQTLNERATRGELDISAVSIHAYAYVCDQYALLPSGASMGDGYGPMLVAKQKFSRKEIAGKKIAVPGTMTSAFLALQLWLGKSAKEFNYIVVPFDEIFKAVREGKAEVGLIIHEGQLTYANEGLVVCEDLGVWWGRENGGLPLPLGGNVIHKRHDAATRKVISDILTGSIQFSLDHRAEAVAHALQYARDMGKDLADKFVGMYVNHWTLDYGEKGRESIRRFLKLAHERGLIPRAPELEFVK